jgi:hypothetical protein
MYWRLYAEMDDALFAAFAAFLDAVERAHTARTAPAHTTALRAILEDATRDVHALERTLEAGPCPR